MKRISGSRLFKAVMIALALFLMLPSSAAFAIAFPDTRIVNSIEAYQSVLETNDQLYLVTFTLEYGTNPTENANEAFLLRLSDNGTEIAAVSPLAFYNSGYSQGVVSFYFDSSDADLPAWSTANISVQLIGNPALSWDGGIPPEIANNTVDSYTVGSATISARIRVLATTLESIYGLDMIEPVQDELLLTDNGESYFEQVIENLRTIAPSLFSTATSAPEFTERTFTQTGATAAEARWIGDPIFDLTAFANMIGVSRIWATSILYIGFCLIILIIGTIKMRQIRPATFLFGALMIVGSFQGFMVFTAGIYCGIGGALAIVFALFYRGAP